jgi:lipopolysaccharide transport system ATP-binding protein
MHAAIKVDDLSKRYRINSNRDPYRTLRESLADAAAAPWRRYRSWRRPDAAVASGSKRDFWALKDISFEVGQGEVLGIIGRNGAGKSTLLKILSRITEPTTGRAEIRGRVGSLLEVGTGFHHELSGRENIYLNGAVLGMSRREVTRKFDEIVAFSEIEEFLDTPVKRYSSGMYIRLAFAVAAHLETELLIVDEVLAVGDVAFQDKCLGKMNNLSGNGRTILFVSHNMPAVRSLTTSCLYLREGRIVESGPTSRIINRYLDDAIKGRTSAKERSLDFYREDKKFGSLVRIKRIWIDGEDGESLPRLGPNDDVSFNCEIESSREYPRACIVFSLTNERGERVATMFSLDQKFPLTLTTGTQVVNCRVRKLPLSPGRYYLTLWISETIRSLAFDSILDYPLLETESPEIESDESEWPQRPWGCIHWSDVSWEYRRGQRTMG